MAGRKLRVGIVGTGGIARSVHIPGYQKLADRVELVSAFDIDEARVTQVSESAAIPYRFTDFDQMLDGPELDAVSICTPPGSHAELAVKAFRRGWHVLCEKPAALHAAAAIEMVRAARQTHRILMIGFQHRFSRGEQALKRLIEGGELGEVYYSRAQSIRRRGIPGWGAFTNKERSGGGPMMDIGVHVLDQTIALLGNPTPVSVFGATFQKLGTRGGGYNSFGPWDPATFEVEDFATAMVRFTNGSVMLLEAAWALNLGDARHNVTLCGTEGGAELNPLRLFKGEYGMLLDTTMPESQFRGADNAQDQKIAHFVDCALDGRQPVTTPSEIVNVALILDAVYASAASGRAVEIATPEL